MPSDDDAPSGFFGQIGQGLVDAVVEGVEGAKQLATDLAQVAVDIATTPEGKEAAWETAKSMIKDGIALTHPLAPKEWKDDVNKRLGEWAEEQVVQTLEEYYEAERNGELPRFFSKKLGWVVITAVTKKVAPKVLPKCPPKAKAKPKAKPKKADSGAESKHSDAETKAKTKGGSDENGESGGGGGSSVPPGGGGTDDVYVIGRQVDTAVAKDWPGHKVLDIPDWTLAKNDAWIQSIIDKKAKIYIGSPQKRSTLWDAVNNRETVFARELRQLEAAGYKQVGDYMVPPGGQ